MARLIALVTLSLLCLLSSTAHAADVASIIGEDVAPITPGDGLVEIGSVEVPCEARCGRGAVLVQFSASIGLKNVDTEAQTVAVLYRLIRDDGTVALQQMVGRVLPAGHASVEPATLHYVDAEPARGGYRAQWQITGSHSGHAQAWMATDVVLQAARLGR